MPARGKKKKRPPGPPQPGIGRRIRTARKHRRWTQEALAAKAACSAAFISQVERAKEPVGIRAAIRFAKALDLSLDFLVRGFEDQPPDLERMALDLILKLGRPQLEYLDSLSEKEAKSLIDAKDLNRYRSEGRKAKASRRKS